MKAFIVCVAWLFATSAFADGRKAVSKDAGTTWRPVGKADWKPPGPAPVTKPNAAKPVLKPEIKCIIKNNLFYCGTVTTKRVTTIRPAKGSSYQIVQYCKRMTDGSTLCSFTAPAPPPLAVMPPAEQQPAPKAKAKKKAKKNKKR